MTTSRQKAIGSAAERVIRAAFGDEATRVGQAGGPVDVIVEGYLELQVKNVKQLPSLNALMGMIKAIPQNGHLRAAVVIERPGRGRKAMRTITFDLDEFAEWHGSIAPDDSV